MVDQNNRFIQFDVPVDADINALFHISRIQRRKRIVLHIDQPAEIRLGLLRNDRFHKRHNFNAPGQHRIDGNKLSVQKMQLIAVEGQIDMDIYFLAAKAAFFMTMTAGRAVFAAPAVTVVPIAMMILLALCISAGGSRFGQFGQKIRLVHYKVVGIQITRFGIFPGFGFSRRHPLTAKGFQPFVPQPLKPGNIFAEKLYVLYQTGHFTSLSQIRHNLFLPISAPDFCHRNGRYVRRQRRGRSRAQYSSAGADNA